MSGVETFQDAVIELEQYKQATGTSSREVMHQPDCAQVFSTMVEMVQQDPEVVDFYAGVMRRYRKTKPESVADEIAVFEERLAIMYDAGLVSESVYAKKLEQLHSGDLVYKEAKTFFRLFGSIVGKDNLPFDRYATKRKPAAVTATPALLDISEVLPPPTPLVEEEAPPTSVETVDELSKGQEYDRMVAAYHDHPFNDIRRRYVRHFDGFTHKQALPQSIRMSSSQSEDGAAFAVLMKQFPLLDGLAQEAMLSHIVQAGVEAHTRLLEADPTADTAALEALAVEGAGAYMTMYECNLRLVMKVARSYPLSATYDINDAIQDGCIGLRRAIQKYQPEKGFKFSTYATWWLRQSIERSRHAHMYSMKLPSSAYQTAKDIQHYIRESEENDGPPPSNAELQEQGFSKGMIYAARHVLVPYRTSLDEPLSGEDSRTRYDKVASTISTDEVLDDTLEHHNAIKRLFGSIKADDRSLAIMSLRMGAILPNLDYSKPITINGHGTITLGEAVMLRRTGQAAFSLDEVGEVFGITRERARQLDERLRLQLLGSAAEEEIAKRLQLDAQEKNDVADYVELNYWQPGRVKPGKIQRVKQTALNTRSLIQLLEADFEASIERASEVIAHNADAKTKIQRWLVDRFVSEDPDTIPISYKNGLVTYGVQPQVANRVDVLFAADLAGVYGKLPIEE